MEILNTIQGQAFTSWTTIGIFAICLVIFGFIFIAAGASANFFSAVVFGIALLVIGAVMTFNLPMNKPTGEFYPTRYEVKITDPNYVIDATLYKIVEKRDKIIVLEEIKQ